MRLVAATAVLAALAAWSKARLPWRDLAAVAVSSLAMGAALWPWRTLFAPPVALALQATAGALIYAILVLVFDVAGSRTLLHQKVSDRIRPRAVVANR